MASAQNRHLQYYAVYPARLVGQQGVLESKAEYYQSYSLSHWRTIVPNVILLTQSLKNNRAKCHPNPIWNDGALAFLKSIYPKEKKKKDKLRYGIRSLSKTA